MDTERLKETWNDVTQHGDSVGLYFYSHLFLTHPEVREMFPLTMDAQRDRLVGALGRVVSNVDQLDDVVPYIQQLGRDHRRFAVVAEHYDAVGASLLWTLQHFLGDKWTTEVARDWADAYNLVAATMVGAAEAAEETEPPWWDGEIVQATRISREVSIIQVQPESPLPYRAGQSMALTIPQAPRVWRYFTPANGPRADGRMEFHVSLVPGGLVSRPLVSSAQVGDQVRLGAPVGTKLAIDPEGSSDLLLVAGSTGITPFLALLDEIEAAWNAGRTIRRVHLVHGARFSWGLYAGARLRHFDQYPWFTVTEAVSDDPTYPGPRGPVGDVAASITMPGSYDALLCGSPAMVSHTMAALEQSPKPPDSISVEEFSTTAELPSNEPTAGEPATIGGLP